MCLIDSHSFFIIYFFEVEEFISDIPSELPCLGNLKNPGQLPVQKDLSIHVSGVKQFSASIPTKMPCLGDFEYPAQPSVHELLPMGDLENLQNRKLFWIFEVLQAWQLSRYVSKWFIDLGNIYIEDIGKIHKTQSSVLLGSSWTESRPRFSWSSERGSSERMSAMDSLTSKK